MKFWRNVNILILSFIFYPNPNWDECDSNIFRQSVCVFPLTVDAFAKWW